jgi:hypothetical protein
MLNERDRELIPGKLGWTRNADFLHPSILSIFADQSRLLIKKNELMIVVQRE